jgi:uncharacterized protein
MKREFIKTKLLSMDRKTRRRSPIKNKYERFIDVAKDYSSCDPAHDYLHVYRVFKNGQSILKQEPDADEEIVLTAILLHEVFNFPKNHPLSSKSGDICSMIVGQLLVEHNFNPKKIPKVLECIKNHLFSKGVFPTTLEEKIVQDADRLDAIGAIGIARCFATSAEMKRPFYDLQDPFAQNRERDDKSFGIDHFYRKLLKLGESMHTATAKQMAVMRINYMKNYLDQLSEEIGLT